MRSCFHCQYHLLTMYGLCLTSGERRPPSLQPPLRPQMLSCMRQEAGGRRQEVRGKVTSPGHTRRRCELAHSISWGRPASPAGCDLNILSASTHTVAMSGHSLTHSSVHPPHQAGVWLLIIISINLLIFIWSTDSSALTI